MNWGKKIVIVYVVFVAGISVLVFKSSNEKFDLVTPDYYAKELKYQDEINDSKRANLLSVPVTCAVENKGLRISFPKEFDNKTISGEVLLYYPADKDRDFTKTFTATNAVVSIPVSDVRHGQYEIKINWKADGPGYYFEQKIEL